MKRRTVLKLLGATGVASMGSRMSVGQATGNAGGPPAPALQGVFFNQLGFQPDRAKVATVVATGSSVGARAGATDGDEVAFRLRKDDGGGVVGEVVFQGKLGAAVADAASGDTVRQADFSAFKTPGVYRLEVGGAVSDAFPVREDAYASALRLTMRAYYGQRCGCAVDLGGGYQHAKCHTNGEYHASSGRAGKAPNAKAGGGWHDAGDYGRYVVNSGITCGTLLWAWEMFPESLHGLRLDIPESRKKTPDYLAEVRWNLEWMLTLQDADGGVFHKQTSEHFCAFILPEKDELTSYVIGTGAEPYKSTCATADLAAVMAIAARCYKPYDAKFAHRCLDAARRGWAWATAHPEVIFDNPAGVTTGGYGDKNCSDEILWASAELWRTTGEAAYEQAFLQGLGDGELKLEAPSWANVASMACWTYVLSGREGKGQARKQAIREATLRTAERLVAQSGASGYGQTILPHEYGWGSNSAAANQSMLLWVATRMEPELEASKREAYCETALNNLHYIVGRNCLGVSWVTQVGTRPFMHPHHRPSAADDKEKPWPGMLSGGPNVGRQDEVAKTLPELPPMRMWIDDQRAYSVNEIAINWNAPLVFLLAAANARRG